jgi:hypothetical protein
MRGVAYGIEDGCAGSGRGPGESADEDDERARRWREDKLDRKLSTSCVCGRKKNPML